MAAQLVEQGFHLVGELGHIGKAEGCSAALHRMRATKDRVQRVVAGIDEVDLEQLGFEAVEVLARFLEKHLVELGQLDARGVGAGEVRAFARHVSHGDA